MAGYARRQAGRAGGARHPSVGLGRSPEGCRPAGQQEQARRHPGAKDSAEGGDGTLAPGAPRPRHQAGHRQQCERRLDQREGQQDAGWIGGKAERLAKGRATADRPLLLPPPFQQEPRSRQGDEDDAGKLAKRQVEQTGREEDGGHNRRQRAALWPGESAPGGTPAEPRTSHHRALRQQQPDGSCHGEGEERQRSQEQRDVAWVDKAKDERAQRLARRSSHGLPDAGIDGRRIGIGAGQQPGARAEPARKEVIGRAHRPRQQRGGDGIGGDGSSEEGGPGEPPAAHARPAGRAGAVARRWWEAVGASGCAARGAAPTSTIARGRRGPAGHVAPRQSSHEAIMAPPTHR